MSSEGSDDRPLRVLFVLHGMGGAEGVGAAGWDPAGAGYEAAVGNVLPMFRTALADVVLAQELLARPKLASAIEAACSPRYHRISLARLLLLQAEADVLAPAGEPLVKAALAQVILDRLAERGEKRVRPHVAMAWWLLGKSLLRSGRTRMARAAFVAAAERVPDRRSEEAALVAVGLAQLHEDMPRVAADTVTALWLRAVRDVLRLDTAAPVAACQSQLGLWLLTTGDRENAATALTLALRSLDSGFAPSLAARVRLALAEAHAGLGDTCATQEHLAAARALYALAPSPAEAVARTWAEAHIAAAGERCAEAEALFDNARHALLAHGSLAEAAGITWDQSMLCLATGRAAEVDDLTFALATAFPRCGPRWSLALSETARRIAAQPEDPHRLHREMRHLLRHRVRSARHRPPLLLPARLLADRLLRRRGEHEDPIGAAPDGI